MSKEQTSEMDALTGGTNAQPAPEKTFDAAEIEKQRHELDNMRGRVKSLDSRNKELEKELAALKAERGRADIVSAALSDEEREKLDPNFLDAAAKIAAASAASVRQEYEERERARQEQDAANRSANEERAKKDFAHRIEERYPGFLGSIGEGGGNSEQWKRFYAFNGPSISSAVARFDIETLAYFIDKFNSELGIRVPSGSQGAATSPDPRNLGSGAAVQHGGSNKVYTAEEYAALEKQASQLRRRGDWDGYRRLNDELNNILAENRVKD